MALAIYYEDLIRQGHVHDYAEIATLAHVTRARVTQIMNLRLLAPSIQEQLLNLSRIVSGRAGWSLRELQSLALEQDWRKLRERWGEVPSLLPPCLKATQKYSLYTSCTATNRERLSRQSFNLVPYGG